MNRSNLWWGITLILLGVLFMLDNMNVLDFGDTIHTYWSAVLVAWGLQMVLKKKKGSAGGEGMGPTGRVEDKN